VRESFYLYQHKRFGILLAWVLGSVAAGLLGMRDRDPLRRHFALQAIAWGGIDAALALFGRGGLRAALRLEAGEMGHA
jgi:hypothetical protein